MSDELQTGDKVDLTDMKPQEHRRLMGYIDDKIRYWQAELQKRMDLVESPRAGVGWGASLGAEKAIAYVDAYQTARVDLFGEALPDEES